MNLDGRVRALGPVPVEPLRAWLDAQSEARWDEDPYRQDAYEVHARTRSIRLVWTHHVRWPDTTTEVLSAWPEVAPSITPILEAATAALGPTTLVNAMLARLDPGASIPSHFDAAALFGVCHRLHVPVRTNPGVRFVIDGQAVRLEQGVLYELNNRRMHGVANEGDTPRVHLILDLAPCPV